MSAVLDDVLPVYRHRERHATQIAAAPEVVWSALHAVSAGDLRLTRVLTAIRALPARLPGSGMPAGGLPATAGSARHSMSAATASCASIRPRRWWRAPRGDPGGCVVAKPPTS